MYKISKLVFAICIFLLSNSTKAQSILVDDTNKTTQELVDLLVGNNCISKSNVNASSVKSVAYFNNNNGAFPISEGIILRNGIAKHTEGSFTNENLSSEINTNGDQDLQKISDASGQSATITDVAFLEFDFTPLANNINFNFLFASNEYGEYQCSFSDVFAIILTNINTGEAVNLAVLPNSDTNISVKNIRDNTYNSGCTSINSNFFSTYNVNDSVNSSLNMKGHTVLLNSSSEVIPGTPYRIKFVIGDYNDSKSDSAVFIEAGSFKAKADLGEDQQICQGGEITLESNFTTTSDYNFQWKKDGNFLSEETNSTLKVTESGIYDVIITNTTTGCQLEDQVVVSDLQLNQLEDLEECYTENTILFNLAQNNQTSLGLDVNEYDLVYYNSLENVTNNIPITSNTIQNYASTGNETIYVRLKNKNTNLLCNTILDFNLTIVQVEATKPNDVFICESETFFSIPAQVESQILNGLNTAKYKIDYFFTEVDANNNTNKISNPTNFSLYETVIWARLSNILKGNCFDVVSFAVNVAPMPLIDYVEDEINKCTSFTLPTLTNGKYFTGPNGTGNELFAGAVIEENTTVYIYNTNIYGCSTEKRFQINLSDNFSVANEHCGQFIVPSYPFANFYTQPDGPNGSGTIIPEGTVITESQSIYFYAENNLQESCINKEFNIIITPIPPVDTLADVITCNSFILPTLTNGKYFTGTNGSGVLLNAGDAITTTQTIYIYNEAQLTKCGASSSFKVIIIDVNNYKDFSACGSYTITNEIIGGYFTQPNGGGNAIPSGTILTESATIYYFAETTTTPNCTSNVSIRVTINPLPKVDTIQDILRCENNLPTLPTVTNGKYFTKSGGLGTQLFAGDVINNSQKIYIYNTNQFCNAETSFTVTINKIPKVDNFTDILVCKTYVLPELKYGNYYTESGGQGIKLNTGDSINTTQTIYIFNANEELETCNDETFFKVTILGVTVDKPEDVKACESYVLPTLNVGNYFTLPNGKGTPLYAGDVITTTQDLYVYAENGNRFFCFDEHIFTITVFQKPNAPYIADIKSCGTATLPTLSLKDVSLDYYRDANYTVLINPSEYNITEAGTQTIYVRSYPTENPNCFTDSYFQATVIPLQELQIEDGIICANYDTGEPTGTVILNSNTDPTKFTLDWYLKGELVGTGDYFVATQTGTYTVVSTKIPSETNTACNYSPKEVEVVASSPKFEVEIMSEDFTDLYSVKVNTVQSGLGDYLYSLEGGKFQDSEYFYNLKPGKYTIIVRDISGICGDFPLEFTALDYPEFFTPNNDGKNDTWNIEDLKNDTTAIIKIYSRLGRFIKQIKTSGLGWNGFNANGNMEITTDYWFVVSYTKNGNIEEYRGNFSLLRQ